MKAVLFKYNANPNSKELRDSADDACGLVDPDFWTNDFPIWSICGPYVRQSLEPGDALVFVPHKGSIISAGLGSDYICSGVMVVSRVVPTSRLFMEDGSISADYRRKYGKSLREHLANDKKRARRTYGIRDKSVIVGRAPREWFGRKGPKLEPIFMRSGLDPEVLANRRIPYVASEKARMLLRLIREQTQD